MATKTVPIAFRVEPQVRSIIDTAATISNLSRSAFIQQAAIREAQAVILAQRDYLLEEKAFEAFERAFDAPPKVLEGMRDLLSRESPWT